MNNGEQPAVPLPTSPGIKSPFSYAWMEEANRVTEEIYWFQRREEEYERDEHRKYDL